MMSLWKDRDGSVVWEIIQHLQLFVINDVNNALYIVKLRVVKLTSSFQWHCDTVTRVTLWQHMDIAVSDPDE